MAHHAEIFVHAVWGTLRRAPLVDKWRREPLFDAIRRKANALHCHALALGGTTDHVHLLARVHPSIPVARLVGEVKGFSSYLANRELEPGPPFRWQDCYWARSISPDELATIERYVLHQQVHHRCNALLLELETRDPAGGP